MQIRILVLLDEVFKRSIAAVFLDPSAGVRLLALSLHLFALSISMDTEASGVPVLGVGQIPIDYLLRKSLIGHGLTVHDAQGNVAFRIGHSSSSARRTKILFDSVGNPLVTVLYHNDEWRCFRGNSQELEDLIFTVHKILYSPTNAELDVLLSSANSSDQKTGFRLKGNPFRRACTSIRGDSIVAQTSLLYKLRKIIYSRNKFRLTVYPGNDCVLAIAMLMVFFWR